MCDHLGTSALTGKVSNVMAIPTNRPRVFHTETTWKLSFPRRFNVEYTCFICTDSTIKEHPLFCNHSPDFENFSFSLLTTTTLNLL